MKPYKKSLNRESVAKDMHEYFVRYETRNKADGVIVKAKTAQKAVEIVYDEYNHEHQLRLMDVRCVDPLAVVIKK